MTETSHQRGQDLASTGRLSYRRALHSRLTLRQRSKQRRLLFSAVFLPFAPSMAIRMMVLFALLYGHLITAACGRISVGIIGNASLKLTQGNSTIINGTCESCLCALMSDPSFFAFNCLSNNLTCEMHSKVDQSKSYVMIASSMSTCYLMALPNYKQDMSTSSFIAAATTSSMGELCPSSFIPINRTRG